MTPRALITTGVVALLLLLLAFAFERGLRGIDFGYHWDETKMVHAVEVTVDTGILLPRWYNYPSVSYGVAVLGLVPELPRVASAGIAAQASLGEAVDAPAFRLRIRTLFLALTLLAGVWTFLLVLRWRRRRGEALLAAALLLASWEVHYHARWVAPDGLMMQLGVLAMLLMLLAVQARRRVAWLLAAAAAAAGLTCGTKYPGGLFLAPLLLTVWLAQGQGTLRGGRRDHAVALLVFAAAFLVSTPGAALDPLRFVRDVVHEIGHYRAGHGGYTVGPVFEHGWRLLEYLGLVAFSRYPLVSLAVAALAIVGARDLVRKERRLAVWFLSVPVLYLVYFASQRVMIARNLLVLLPFLAVLAARAWTAAVAWLPARPLRVAAHAVLAALVVLNLAWLHRAAESIADRASLDHRRNLLAHLDAHPDRRFYLTDGAVALAGGTAGLSAPNLTGRPGDADRVVVATDDVATWRDWVQNERGLYTVVSGPWEVNWDYYASWEGEPRLLAVAPDDARRLGVVDGR